MSDALQPVNQSAWNSGKFPIWPVVVHAVFFLLAFIIYGVLFPRYEELLVEYDVEVNLVAELVLSISAIGPIALFAIFLGLQLFVVGVFFVFASGRDLQAAATTWEMVWLGAWLFFMLITALAYGIPFLSLLSTVFGGR